MSRGENDYISMQRIKGDQDAKMCTFSTVEFREECIALAKKYGLTLQDFLLMALRDKVYGEHKGARTAQGRRHIALERLFLNKRTPKRLKEAIDQLLTDYLPKVNANH